jgi:CheY-like chemotaxis protein
LSPRPAERRLEGVHVVVVDDNIDACETLRYFLEYHGALVRVALSGLDALDILEYVTPDLVITDLAMPGMHGPRLLEEIRKRPGGAAVPVVALTAFPETYLRTARRFDAFLRKPLDPGTFFRLVGPLIGR